MRLNLRTKLIGSYIVVLAVMSLVALLALQSASRTQAAYADLVDRRDKIVNTVKDFARQIEAASSDAGWYALTREQEYVDRIAPAQERAEADVDFILANVRPEDKPLADKLVGPSGNYWAGINDMTFQFKTISATNQPLTSYDMNAIVIPIHMNQDTLNAAIAEMERFQEEQSKLEREAAAQQYRLMQQIIIILGGLMTVVSLVWAWLMSGSLARPVLQTARAAQRLAQGDLTVTALKVKSRDEVGDLARAFNQMITNLRQLMGDTTDLTRQVSDMADRMSQTTGDVAKGAQSVATTVQQVAAGAATQTASVDDATRVVEEVRTAIAQVASGAQEQARSAQETSIVLAEMMTAIDDVAAKAANVDASSTHAVDRARNGEQVVARTVRGMEQIQNSVVASSEQIRELGRLSEQIGAITSAISEIADQTNLLALNAAIEAARAGEHGRGFAVVADEVRKLAERAGKSAGEIAELIGSIQSGTAKAVSVMEQVTAEVQGGTKNADETNRSLHEILAVVEETTRDVAAIKAAANLLTNSSQKVLESANAAAATTEENTATAEEMAAGADQLTSAMTGIAEVTEQNAAAAQEVSSAIEEMSAGTEAVAASAEMLREIAERLRTQVERFQL